MSTGYRFDQDKLNENLSDKSKVKLTDLLSRLNDEKKKERNSNIAAFSCCCLSSNGFWYNTFSLKSLFFLQFI